jgi:hypothetical protein
MDEWSKIGKKKNLGEFPKEVSENIEIPEVGIVDSRLTSRVDELEKKLVKKQLTGKMKDLRVTGRVKIISFSCRPEFYRELKYWAYKEDCRQIEVLERAFEEYKKKGGKDAKDR